MVSANETERIKRTSTMHWLYIRRIEKFRLEKHIYIYIFYLFFSHSFHLCAVSCGRRAASSSEHSFLCSLRFSKMVTINLHASNGKWRFWLRLVVLARFFPFSFFFYYIELCIQIWYCKYLYVNFNVHRGALSHTLFGMMIPTHTHTHKVEWGFLSLSRGNAVCKAYHYDQQRVRERDASVKRQTSHKQVKSQNKEYEALKRKRNRNQ